MLNTLRSLIIPLTTSAIFAGAVGSALAADSLTVALPTLAADSLNYVAKAEGIFEKHGLDVTFAQTNPATLASTVAAGQADIGVHAAGIALSIANAGKQTAIIFATTGGGQGGSVVGGPDLASIESLKDKPDCKIGTLSAGTSAAGFSVLYKQQIGLTCDIVPFQDVPSQIGALTAKRVDVLIGAYPNFAGAVADGKAKLVVDTRDVELSQKYLGDPFPEVAAFGLTENLAAKKPAIINYLKALAEAQAFIEANPPATVAASIKKLPELAERPEAAVENDVKILQAYRFRGSDKGRINEAQWKLALERIALWGLPNFTVDNPVFAYGTAVDMTYYDEAFKQ